MTQPQPRISLIMPVKNAATTVAEAVASFTGQDWVAKELIIIDGLSGDDTTAEVMRVSTPDVRIERRADASATEALIRGAVSVTGNVIGLLMADDWLAPGALSRVGAIFAAEPDTAIVSGGVRIVDETSGAVPPPVTEISGAALGLGLESILGAPYPAAFFFRTHVWRDLGGFSPAYRYGADRDFLMRCRLAGYSAHTIAAPVYIYRKHEGSDTLVDNEDVVKAFLADHWAMAADWLKHPALSPADARRIGAWRREQAVELAARQIRGHETGDALRLLVAQCLADPMTFGAGASRFGRYLSDKLRASVAKSRPSG